MKRFTLLKTMLLLCALIVGSGNLWGQATPYYTLDTSLSANAGTNNSYTSEGSKEVNGINWYATGNMQMQPWRIGGKASSSSTTATLDVSRTVYTATAMDKAIESINLYIGDVTVNTFTSVKLTVSSKADFSSITDEITKSSPSANSTLTFTPTSGSSWDSNLYYKFTINATLKGKSNTYVQFSKVEFYKEELSISSLTITSAPTKVRYEVGETLDMTGFVLDADGSDVDDGYTMTMGGASIVDGATLSSVGKKAITVSYGGKEVTQNISVGAVTSIAVTTAPTKTAYSTGDSFDPTGMVVTASLSTGEDVSPDTWTKEVTGYTVDPEDDLAPANTYVTITYATKTATQAITVTNVAVTGVSLKASATIEKGKTETLTPTITPVNATNKLVLWDSDNTSVATVSDEGVVTAVAAGTANITVLTDDGNFEATCVVTVVNQKGSIDAPYSVAEVIDMNPGTTASKTDVYVIGYIAGCVNGSNGALNPVTAVNTNLALVDDPDDTSNYISVQLPSGDFRTTFNVVDHPYLKGVTQILIKADIIKYCGIPGLKYIDEMTAVAEAVTVTDAGYATYTSDFGLDYSGLGVKAYQATVSGSDITFNKVTEVPAGEGVLLQNEGTFVVPVKSVTAWGADDNAFVRGNDAAVATDNGDGKYNYILNKVGSEVGFFKANGQTVAKNRAYLQTSTSQARISLDFDDNETTGITAVQGSECKVNGYYNLAGQRVAQPTKGLYVVNGKKLAIK